MKQPRIFGLEQGFCVVVQPYPSIMHRPISTRLSCNAQANVHT
jgi:hypothetical protein